jgi:methionyl-tRNA synthetase
MGVYPYGTENGRRENLGRPARQTSHLRHRIGGTEMITLTREEGYYCVVCGRFLPEENGVIVHDDVPHSADMDFGDEEKPQ